MEVQQKKWLNVLCAIIFIVYIFGFKLDMCSRCSHEDEQQDETDTELVGETTEQKQERAIEETPKKEVNPYANFIGEYMIYSEDGVTNHSPYIVVDDGRFFQNTVLGGKNLQKCGKIYPISEKAFKLFISEQLHTGDVFSYRDNHQDTRHGYINWGKTLVFDLSEKRIYIDMNDYENRDYASPEYYKFRFTKK